MADIDLQSIAQMSGILDNSQDAALVCSKIDNVKNEYKKGEVITIYNYLLSNAVSPDVCMYLIKQLDEYRDASTLQYLVDILLFRNAKSSDISIKEQYVNVRVMCAKAIANMKNNEAISSLLFCLNNKDENYRVRLACADALGRIGDRFAVAPLIDVVNDEDEKSVYVQESAVLALGLLGDSRAVDSLVGILETKRGLVSKFSYLKERAIEALIRLGFCNGEKVFRALKHSLSDESSQIRINAIEALMESEHPNAYEEIKHCLINDSDEEVKKNAMIALYNMSDRKILDEVINSTQYSDTLKMEAVAILNDYENDEEED